MSYNQFTTEDTIAIGDGLRENHTLLGFHAEENNSAKVDSLGFIMLSVNSKGERYIDMKKSEKDIMNCHSYNQMKSK